MSMSLFSPGYSINNKAESLQDSTLEAASSKTTSSWSMLPKDLLQIMTHFLSPEETGRSLLICKLWKKTIDQNNVWNWQSQRLGINLRPEVHQILSDYRSDEVPGGEFDYHLLRIISQYDNFKIENAKQEFVNPRPLLALGKEAYSHLGDPGEIPRLPSKIHEILQSQSKFWPQRTVEETSILVLIAKNVTRIEYVQSSKSKLQLISGYPVTIPYNIENLDKLIKTSAKGNRIGYDYICPGVLKKHGSKTVEKPYWALLTNDVIPRSGNKNYPFQKQLVEQAGHVVPEVIDLATAILLENQRSGKRFFGDNPLTYARSSQKVQGYHIVVGGFAPAGLYFPDCLLYDRAFIGVAPLRKFF